MLTRTTYSIEKIFVSDQYIDFSLSFVDADKVSFSFVYRKSGATSWEQNAVIEASQASVICGNTVDRVVLEDGTCDLRWYYSLTGIEYRDSVEVKIDPFFHSSMFVFLEDKTAMVELGASGFGNISILAEKRFGEDYYLSGDSLYYNGNLLYSGVTGSYVTSFTLVSVRRFLIADSLNNRLVEVNEYGSVISSHTDYFPTYCEYDASSGNVLLVDSFASDVKEIYWKSGNNPHPNIGDVIWSYNTEFPAFPLIGPKSATYGVSENIIISDSSVIKIDRTTPTRTEYSYFEYKKKSGTNQYFPNSLMVSFEIVEDELFSAELLGSVLPYSSVPTSHITYNRSLRDDSSLSFPRALENSLFYPIRPIISSTDDTNVTLDLLNSSLLLKRTNDAYMADGQKVPVFKDLVDGCARGNVMSDIPFWGMLESYNRGIGTQNLVCVTGQPLHVKIPYHGEKIGYKKQSASIDPVYVKENVAVDFVDVFSGDTTVALLSIDFSEDISFSINIPEASQESYQRSISNGFHGHYLIKITVTESYYSTNLFEEKVMLDRIFYFYLPVFSFWWRQIFKEITIPLSPVTSSFDLLEFSQTMSYFFDYYTCYPSFYKIVGSTTLSITEEQKEKIIAENALALFSYYSGFCPGDSPISNAFGFGASSYVASENQPYVNLHRIDLTERKVEPRLPGLNAEYQAINLFNYNPGVVCSSWQYVRDLFPVMLSNQLSLKADWLEGGMMTMPVNGQLIAEDVYTLDGSQTLSFDIDAPDISIDSITIKGGYYNSDDITPGETKITLSFTSSSVDIQEVKMGVSVDDCVFVTYNDPSGNLRQFVFTTPKSITNTSVVNGFIELTDSNQNSFVYYVTKKVKPTSKTSSVNNVRISIDRPGKLLKVSYDLNTKYQFVPYAVSLYLKIEGEYFDVSGSASGDIGNVFFGFSKLITLNYAETIADEDLQRGSIMMKIVLTPLLVSETTTQSEFSLLFRSPALWDNKITEEVAVVISNQQEALPNKIINSEKIYSIGTWDVSDFSFDTPGALISFSSSSSSLISESCSSSSSLSSVSLSSWSLSCCSSSSSSAS